MKILYDHQIFTSQRYGGISRYFYELVCKFFSDTQKINYEIPLLVSNNYYISDKKFVNYIDLLPSKQFRGKHKIFSIINKPYSIMQLKQQKFDVFHPTYYDPYFLKYLGNKPFILTVYDMIHEKFPQMFTDAKKITEQKKLLTSSASKIITISESTKKDLIDIFGIEKSKIEVIYLGNSMHPKLNTTLDFELPKKYLLFVGSRAGYKNFNRFIISVSELLNQDKELYVLCTGGGKFNDHEIKQFNELGISKKVLQYNLDDDSLAYFYKHAFAFIFPSLYEGFGIPVLESFACGCPLLCSDVSSLPEVAGESAYYFDPYSEESIRDAVLRVLDDTNLRKDLIAKGKERLKQFSWQKTAEQTKKVYESVLI